jgi:hypothetical protein
MVITVSPSELQAARRPAAGPHPVDACARREDLYRLAGADAHEEDHVRVVLGGLVAETLGPLADNCRELLLGGTRTRTTALSRANAWGSAFSMRAVSALAARGERRIALPLWM